jgi:hypothetical protein
MFGIKMRDLRICMCGVFMAAFLLCIIGALWFFQRTFHAQLEHALSHPRVFLIDAIFPAMAFIYAAAFWTVWKEKTSARIWGVAASTLQILMPLYQIFRFSRVVWRCDGFVLATGIVGLIVFLRPYKKESYMDDSDSYETETDDTNPDENPS